MTHTRSDAAPLLPPVALTPEEAAAVALALVERAGGPYAQAGEDALEKVLAVLEPDPRRRAELQAAGRRGGAAAQGPTEAGRSRHPAGRARRARPGSPETPTEAPQPPRLLLLRGGPGQ